MQIFFLFLPYFLFSITVAILAMPLFGLCISVYWMVYIGFLSAIGYLLTTAFAPTTLWLAYIGKMRPFGFHEGTLSNKIERDN